MGSDIIPNKSPKQPGALFSLLTWVAPTASVDCLHSPVFLRDVPSHGAPDVLVSVSWGLGFLAKVDCFSLQKVLEILDLHFLKTSKLKMQYKPLTDN